MPAIDNILNSITSIPMTDQTVTPTTPSTGKSRIFTKADGLYWVDDTGAVTGPLVSGQTPWLVILDSMGIPLAQTNWSTKVWDATNGPYLQSSGAQNAEISWKVLLGAGTWAIEWLGITGANNGIVTAYLDAASVGTVDCYAGGSSLNVSKSITGISVATTAAVTVKFVMATKNASSSAYYGQFHRLQLRRTA